MHTPQVLLERMASISPGARAHITGQLWQQNIKEDEITEQLLVGECFSVVIGEAYELGIEFHCPIQELCASNFDIDLVLLLFESIFPASLYRSITEDTSFKTWISAVIIDGAGEPGETSIYTILSHLAEEYPNIYQPSFVFLFDKMTSTPVFDAYVESILTIDNTPIAVIVNPDDITNYLQYVESRVMLLRKATEILVNNLPNIKSDVEILYSRIDIYKANSVAARTLDQYSWMYHKLLTQSIFLKEQALIARYKREFQSITPLYTTYYDLFPAPMDRVKVLSLILGCLESATTKEAFMHAIDDCFAHQKDPLSVDLHSLAQSASLLLLKEYFA